MEFLTVRDFRNNTKKIWEKLQKQEKFVITNNGKPAALMLPVNGSTLEEMLSVVRQSEMMRLLSKMQMQSVRNGTSNMTMDEIDAEIAAARRERRARERKAA
jgi:antitoxin (DNA-binding transcriptional repressor) of toxin-antitoxin stability system